ncbi:MAG: hypothetical protein HYU67_12335 [Flavobacteriia bacterium]|nr:hypothetical protein [Flavobacteriia bacterium]
MNTSKLTLSISEDIILKAKEYAKKNGTSISFLIERFLTQITQKENEKFKHSTSINKLKGVIQVPEDYDYKKELANLISK